MRTKEECVEEVMEAYLSGGSLEHLRKGITDSLEEHAKDYSQYLMQRWVAALQMPVIPMTGEQSDKLYETFLQSQSTNH